MKRLSELTHSKQITFYDALADRLPNNIHGADHKRATSNFMDKYKAIHDHKFIRFNTKQWVQTLIFDIDHVHGTSSYWFKKFIDSTGIKPSYVVRTDNGIQIGIFLDEKIYITDYDGNSNTNRQRLAALKKIIGKRMQFAFMDETLTLTDIAGSNRLLGIWRNPIVHDDTTISTQSYSLDALLKHFQVSKSIAAPQRRLISHSNSVKMTLSTPGAVQTYLNDGFFTGNRNNYLFGYGFKTVFENRSTLPDLEALIQRENNLHTSPLTSNEVSNIANSIEKLVPTMYQPNPKEITKAKYRQFMWTNNIHGEFNRYSFGAFITAQNKREKTSSNILDAMLDLFQAGINNPTNKQVTDKTNIDVRQWQKLKSAYDVKAVFLAFIDNLFTDTPIDIKAKYTPLLKRVFEGINKQIVKSEKTGEVMIKYIFDGQRWVKPYEDQLQAA